jgi:hypothetical protein
VGEHVASARSERAEAVGGRRGEKPDQKPRHDPEQRCDPWRCRPGLGDRVGAEGAGGQVERG